MAADSTSPASVRIQAALREYFEAPGKFPIGSRQPEVLFNAMQDVLQIAAGRTPDAFAPPAEGLQDAAAFFVGAALLYPGADHYSLLGLPAAREPLCLKERYRLLMRLIHPDFADSVRANWPKDSAMRVNRAYEVLSSPVLRREYDEQLANSGGHQRVAMPHAVRRTAPAAPRNARVPRLRIGKTAAWAVIIILSLLAVIMLMPHRDPVRIVQKPKPAMADVNKAVLAMPQVPAQTPQVPEPQREPAMQVVPPPLPQSTVLAETPGTVAAAATANSRLLQVEAGGANRAVQLSPPVPAPVAAAVPPRTEMPQTGNAELRATAVATPTRTPAPVAMTLPEPALQIRAVAIRSRSAPTLSDAQPLLNQLLLSLESGSSDQLLQVLEAEARHTASAQSLSHQYQRLVGRSAVTLSHFEFKGEPRDDVLVVTGNVRLQIGRSTIGSLGEKLVLRAEFMSRGGRVALTGLSEVAE